MNFGLQRANVHHTRVSNENYRHFFIYVAHKHSCDEEFKKNVDKFDLSCTNQN